MFYQAPILRPYHEKPWGRRVFDRVDVLNSLYRLVVLKLDSASLKSAHRVLVNSRFTRGDIRRIYGVEADVCYHGIDVDVFRPLGLSKDKMVLSVGALKPVKGFDFIIESLSRIPSDWRPRLFIVSNYEEEKERSYLTQLAGVKRVEVSFLTLVVDKCLVELYNRAIVTVYGPVHEPFGLVPLESMACGTPVVAVGEGGVRESVVHEQTGLLTNRDPGQFAAAVRTLLENEALVRLYGEQARKCALEKWSWDAAIRRLEQHLAQVASHEVLKGDNE
jgi:glycosyltransferase involved in cell wall biosynthesis